MSLTLAQVADTGLDESTAIGLYLLYALIAFGLVIFLARNLHRSGRVFLAAAFDEEEVGEAVNKLLLIGFYLLNLGYALLVYQLQPEYPNLTTAFNELVQKLGILLVSLGVVHMMNMLVLWRIRNGRRRPASADRLPAPTVMVPPPPGTLPPPPAPYPVAGQAGGPDRYPAPLGGPTRDQRSGV